jgi:quaternary ammonium compound-resistance protein SugE
VWVGVGAVGTVILGIVLLGEPTNPGRLISVALIIAGIIGLKMATPA